MFEFMIGGCAGSSVPRNPRPKYGHPTTSFGLWDAEKSVGFIIDNGTGVQFVSEAIVSARIKEIHVLQTHFHDDHINGLQLNQAFFTKSLSIHAPDFEASFQDIFAKRFQPAVWPISPASFGIKHNFKTFQPGSRLELAGMRIETFFLNHPGGAIAYRFEEITKNGESIVFASDNELASCEGHQSEYAKFVSNAGILIADAQYRTEEYEGVGAIGSRRNIRKNWGHSTPNMIAATLEHCSTRPERIILVHHDPERTDEDLDNFYEDALEMLPDCQMGRWNQMVEL